MTLARSKQLGLPTKSDLFENGLLKPGMIVQIRSYPNSDAEIVDQMMVKYQGSKMPFSAWGKLVTGWPSISLFKNCRVKDGATFSEMRGQLLNGS